ncbi:MAG: hypothetical protein ACPIOQ_82145, partial [Promethearchaeia archaeon]
RHIESTIQCDTPDPGFTGGVQDNQCSLKASGRGQGAQIDVGKCSGIKTRGIINPSSPCVAGA